MDYQQLVQKIAREIVNRTESHRDYTGDRHAAPEDVVNWNADIQHAIFLEWRDRREK